MQTLGAEQSISWYDVIYFVLEYKLLRFVKLDVIEFIP